VVLGGANTYRGDTIIDYGTVKLTSGGSFASSARIIVGGSGSTGVVLDLTDKTSFSIGAGQTLMGGGTALLGDNTALTVAGTFSPGNSPGLFTYSNGTTLLAGTTLMEILGTSRATSPSHGDGFYDAVDVTSGGVLNFNDSILALSFDSLFSEGDTFDLFKVFDTASLAGNFGSVTVLGDYYSGLTWSNTGTGWASSTAAGGESLSFNATTGTLSVIIVPEPDTIIFAGIGIALAGWTVWKRRRIAQITARTK
jgi:autotransporter-associated beta strand protein